MPHVVDVKRECAPQLHRTPFWCNFRFKDSLKKLVLRKIQGRDTDRERVGNSCSEKKTLGTPRGRGFFFKLVINFINFTATVNHFNKRVDD
jgi:hypothetical protein